MKLENIKTPQDVLEFMKQNIKYGWLDINNEKHINNMKDFRRLYRISSIEETLETHLGTCIEQVHLMKYLLSLINIPSKMFCTRIYEPDNFHDLDAEEHMHCFLLYYQGGHVYHIEHPNYKKIGIYEFPSEEQAIQDINNYFVEQSGGTIRVITQFYNVEKGLSFQEFNCYINSLDKPSTIKKK